MSKTDPYHPSAVADEAENALTDARGVISEDVWSVWFGVLIVGSALLATWFFSDSIAGWMNKPGEWEGNPLASLSGMKAGVPVWLGTFVSLAVIGIPLGFVFAEQGKLTRGLVAYSGVAMLAVIAMIMSGQSVVKYYNLEYVLWALLLGMIIGNTVGVPRWLHPSVRGELFIKLGLVLLGMEVLMGKLVVLGLPGILVSWVVTPIVLITTFWFGNRVLRIESPSLTMTVAADMSVCGVSAAIATGAACKAKKEELSLAISLSLAFTAVMMVVMPIFIRIVGMDDIVGGAWLGGTIDSTGAVAAAGAALGDRALKIATTVKMIQNILIGVIAFAVSVYWAARYREAGESQESQRGFFEEVWARFPKFVLGFLAVSVIASLIDWSGEAGADLVKATIDGVTKELRNWLFCLAFVCIGLEMQVATLGPALRGGKPMILYVVGQALNLLLTGLMAWIVFGWLFRESIVQWLPPVK
jgi:uncharacterized integral membrane protein (TIGR00698 family)